MHKQDLRLLREAYFEALKAAGNSDPNPSVGAIVTDTQGNVLSRGYTQRAGYAHAERMALQLPGIDFRGKTIYVTLEPCCHHGRTPPCTDIILESGIRRVVIAERDFAAEVMGKSVDLLRSQGLEVEVAAETQFAEEKFLTTGPFFEARRRNRPRIVLKWAQTSDGALAPTTGPSGKISGPGAAAVTAALRNYYKFTLATPGTIRSDRPRLDVRPPESGVPWYATGFSELFANLLHAQLQPPQAVVATALKHAARGYLAAPMSSALRGELLDYQRSLGPNFFLFEESTEDMHGNFAVVMSGVLAQILQLGFNSVLIEAGPRFSQSLLDAGLVDLLVVYQSKKISAENIWGETGRGNEVSRALARRAGEKPEIPSFELMESADLDTDTCLVFRRTEHA